MSFRDWLPRIPALARARAPVAKAAIADIREASLLAQFGAIAEPDYANYMATSIPAYRAVHLRAQAVSTARAVVGMMQTDEDGVSQFTAAENDPIQDMLDRVNPWFTHADLWYATEAHLSLNGVAFWFLDDSPEGRVIWPLHPERVRVVPGRGANQVSSYVDHFKYMADSGREVRLGVDEVLWFRRYNPVRDMELEGLAPIAPARLSLDMGWDALRFNRNFFKNSATPSDIAITFPTSLTDEEVDSFYKRWDKRFRGAGNAHRPLLVAASGQGVGVSRIGISQKEMEFLAGLRWTVEDAARAWGVPPPLMYSQEASIYNNVSEANKDFWRSTIMAEWKFLETQLTERLLPLMGEEGLEIRFDWADILPLQESMSELQEQERKDVEASILTINEVRERRGLAPVDWGDEPKQPASPFGVVPEFGEEEPKPPPRSYMKAVPYIEEFGLLLRRLERQFEDVQRRLFTEQAQETLTRVGRGIPPSAAFTEAEWREVFAKTGKPYYERAVVLAAAQAAGRFRLTSRTRKAAPKPPPFSLSDPAIQQWLQRRIELWSVLANEETGRLINQEIGEAAEAGESIRQIQDRLERVFRFNDSVRSERIARTEMLATSNRGHLASYEQSGVVDRIRWVATADERTRETHAAADGQVVNLGEPFHVGNAFLDAPGVGQGGTIGLAEEVVNCRCAVVPVFERRQLNGLEDRGRVPGSNGRHAVGRAATSG